MDRNDFSEEEAQARIDSQLPIEEKKKRGDHLIDNSGLFSETGWIDYSIYMITLSLVLLNSLLVLV
jgi:dephospho-CoA kinase